MKLRCLLFLLFLVNGLAIAQLRESVCIVSPQYDTDIKVFVDSVAEKLNKTGYRDLSRQMSDRLESGFGSGVVVTGADKTRYVLSNQHVVSLASVVTIEFHNTNGEIKKYENCTVFAVDEQLDLVLISLPEAADNHPAIELSRTAVHDGDEIWSAGYPGLSGEPSWQFGKGTITNEAARLPNFIDPELSVLYQHSAPVDPGNSGGPLLQSIRGQRGTYTIAGINTWKAFSRQSANFAVPAATIETFIKKATSKDHISMKDLQVKSDSFISNFSTEESSDEEEQHQIRSLSKLLSIDVLKDRATDDVVLALAKAPSMVRNEILQYLSYSLLFDGMRVAIAWNLVEQFHASYEQGILSSSTVFEAMEPKTLVPIGYTVDSKEVLTTSWQYNKQSWSILSIKTTDYNDTEKSQEGKKSKGDRKSQSLSFEELPYEFQVQAEMSMRNDITFFGVYVSNVGKFYALGFGASMGFLDEDEEDEFDTSLIPNKITEIFGFVKLQLPIDLTSFTIVPYATGRAGLVFTPDDTMDSGFKLIPLTGIDIVFNTTIPFIIGGGWILDFESGEENFSGPFFTIGLGF